MTLNQVIRYYLAVHTKYTVTNEEKNLNEDQSLSITVNYLVPKIA